MPRLPEHGRLRIARRRSEKEDAKVARFRSTLLLAYVATTLMLAIDTLTVMIAVL